MLGCCEFSGPASQAGLRLARVRRASCSYSRSIVFHSLLALDSRFNHKSVARHEHAADEIAKPTRKVARQHPIIQPPSSTVRNAVPARYRRAFAVRVRECPQNCPHCASYASLPGAAGASVSNLQGIAGQAGLVRGAVAVCVSRPAACAHAAPRVRGAPPSPRA
ncbi:hypothetical protein BV25DRAFT_1917694 [Artomyces pyxidatus]|uniref:Uncharacterized protein n=1 Tax=Artomyces pyxidatus TaxID=48021 RepID=A0ACB8SXP5_9AGAM|nr:hypothetical protein BV25DRAFT_1917694 [Artomyces pyxidatus]